MKTRPLPGVTLERALSVLSDVRDGFGNAGSSAHEAMPRYNAYIKASSIYVRMLEDVLPAEGVRRLVTTPGHYALIGLDPAGKPSTLGWLVGAEFDARAQSLEAAIISLRAQAARFDGVDLVVVPDTNALIHHARSVGNIAWGELAPADARRVVVAVPQRVVDELDKLKRAPGNKIAYGEESVRIRAQRTLRKLEEWSANGSVHELPDTTPPIAVAIEADDPTRVRLPDADADIIEVACDLATLADRRLVLVAADFGMRLRARTAGLTAAEAPGAPGDEG